VNRLERGRWRTSTPRALRRAPCRGTEACASSHDIARGLIQGHDRAWRGFCVDGGRANRGVLHATSCRSMVGSEGHVPRSGGRFQPATSGCILWPAGAANVIVHTLPRCPTHPGAARYCPFPSHDGHSHRRAGQPGNANGTQIRDSCLVPLSTMSYWKAEAPGCRSSSASVEGHKTAGLRRRGRHPLGRGRPAVLARGWSSGTARTRIENTFAFFAGAGYRGWFVAGAGCAPWRSSTSSVHQLGFLGDRFIRTRCPTAYVCRFPASARPGPCRRGWSLGRARTAGMGRRWDRHGRPSGCGPHDSGAPSQAQASIQGGKVR